MPQGGTFSECRLAYFPAAGATVQPSLSAIGGGQIILSAIGGTQKTVPSVIHSTDAALPTNVQRE